MALDRRTAFDNLMAPLALDERRLEPVPRAPRAGEWDLVSGLSSRTQ